MKRALIRALAGALIGVCAGLTAPDVGIARAQERIPLLIEGKKTLYQRVLTRPGARLRNTAGGPADAKDLPPLTHLFVYARQQVQNQPWLEVGSASRGATIGWLPAEEAVDWRQTLTLAFTNPAGRERTLFFRERASLEKMLEAKERIEQVGALRKAIAGRDLPSNFPVISIEPATHIDINKQFYLLPILKADEVLLSTGFPMQVMEVASINLRKGEEDTISQQKLRTTLSEQDSALAGFKSAVVFVIDTTISMGPYIERTRDAVRRVYSHIEAAKLGDRVNFGLVAFRNNTKASPGLEYVSKVYAKPSEVRDVQSFTSLVSAVQEAKASSHQFNEDAMAGVETAINEIDWSSFAGRYLVLITDAGALRANDPMAKTGLDVEQVRRMALDKGMAIYALHLLTPAGRRTHAGARGQYETLTTYPNLSRPLYYPVEAGSIEQFGATIDALAVAITQQVQDAIAGKLSGGRTADTQGGQAAPSKSTTASVEADVALVGRAMQLAYLGREKGSEAPRLYRAWAANRDFANPDTTALEARVLLTKNQLGDLQKTLQLIVESAKKGQIAPQDFFDQLRSAAAIIGRDPSRVGRQGARKLGELGLMGEYLDDLPFKSKIMSIDSDQWERMSIGEQQAFIDEIEAKVRLYQRYHDDVDKWVFLDGGAVPGDAVYPIVLETLP